MNFLMTLQNQQLRNVTLKDLISHTVHHLVPISTRLLSPNFPFSWSGNLKRIQTYLILAFSYRTSKVTFFTPLS